MSNAKINFPDTDGKCIFYCIAYHKNGKKKDPQGLCWYHQDGFGLREQSNGLFTNSFKNFKGVDIYDFDELEQIFKLKIEVYEMNLKTEEVSRIRESNADYDDIVNILDYKGHAMLIVNLDNICGATLVPSVG